MTDHLKIENTENINEVYLNPTPIPQHYVTVEEYCEVRVNRTLTQETYLEVNRYQQRQALSLLEPQLAEKITEYARQKGMTPEELIHLWLNEKFTAATQSDN